jgi:hypothetical protein
MRMSLLLVGTISLAVSIAQAQTKITGTVTCTGKSAKSLLLPIADKPGHALATSEDHCSWSKPFQLNGSPVTNDVQTSYNEIDGNTAKGYGYDVGDTAAGDKYFMRFEGPATLQSGIMVSSSGKWSFIGGTGKLAKLKGGGTFTCKGTADSTSCDVVGDYSLAP